MRWPHVLILILIGPACAGRGPVDGNGTSDDGGGPTANAAGCAIATGNVVVGTATPAQVMFMGDTLTCSGNAGGSEVTCGSGLATLTYANCSDGYVFSLVSGSDTVEIRLQASASGWSAGAQINGVALAGNISFSNIEPPNELPPSAGTTITASFVLQAVTGGQGAVVDGELQATW